MKRKDNWFNKLTDSEQKVVIYATLKEINNDKRK